MPLQYYLILSTLVFVIGLAGIFLNRKNVIVILMCIELMLLAVGINFVSFANYYQDLSGQIFVFFVLAVAAAESAVGLALLILLFRVKNSVQVDDWGKLQG